MRPSRAQIAKRLTLLVGCVLLASVGQAQSLEASDLPTAFAWDYPDEWVAEFSVERFEIRIDGGTPSREEVSIPSVESEGYLAPIPSLSTGEHLVEVRACNSSTCGEWSTPVRFVFSHLFTFEVQPFGFPSDPP